MTDHLGRERAPADDSRDSVDLAVRIREGDASAEAVLVERFQRVVMIVLERHTGGRPEAEDLFQDTFEMVVTKMRRGELRNPAALPVFVTQIARNLALEHYRKLRRRRTEPDSQALEQVVAASNPFDDVHRQRQAEAARAVLGSLRHARDRQVLFRYYLAEDSRQDIADDLGLDLDQLRKILHRARERFRDQFLRTRRAVSLLLMLCIVSVHRHRCKQ